MRVVGVDTGRMGLGQVSKYRDWTAGEEKGDTHLVGTRRGRLTSGKGGLLQGPCGGTVAGF